MDNIPIPKIELPPEIKDLINDIRKNNLKIEEREKQKKPTTDAEYITTNFKKQMKGFENAYAYLTEKLADKLIDGFTETVVELIESKDIQKDSRSILHGIHLELIESRKDALKLYNLMETIDMGDQKFQKGFMSYTDFMKREELERRKFTARYQYMSAQKGEDDQATKARYRDVNDRLGEETGVGGGLFKGLGNLLGIKHVKSFAGFMGAMAMGPFKYWDHLIKPGLIKGGIFGAITYLGYQALFGTFGQMYDAYRNQQNSVVWSATKALGEVIADIVQGTIRSLGFEEFAQDLKDQNENRRDRNKIKGEIIALKKRLKELAYPDEEADRLADLYENMIKDSVELKQQLRDIEDDIEKGSFWIQPTKEQIEIHKNIIPKLIELRAQYNKKLKEETDFINSSLTNMLDEYNSLLMIPTSQLTPEQQKRIEQLAFEMKQLQRRKSNIETFISTVDKQMKRSQEIKDNLFGTWEDSVEDWKRISDIFKRWTERLWVQNQKQKLRWDNIWKQNTLLKKIDAFNTWLTNEYWTDSWLDKFFIQPLNKFGVAWKDKITNSMTEYADKIIQTIKDFQVFGVDFVTDINKWVSDQLTGIKDSFIDWLKRLIDVNKSFKDIPKLDPTQPMLRGPSKDDPYLQPQKFGSLTPDLTPTGQTELLKAIGNLAKVSQQLQLANVVSSSSTNITNSNAVSTNVSAPVINVASTAPQDVPWSSFTGYGTMRTGYSI